MICSVIEIELAIVASIAGHGLSYCASLRAARIDAASGGSSYSSAFGVPIRGITPSIVYLTN
jgi:hypothetical protein